MSNDDSRRLLALLVELAEAELDDGTEERAQQETQTLLSRLVDSSIVERIEYARYEIEWAGGTPTVQGLALASAEVLLSELLLGLAAAENDELVSLGTPLGITPAQMRTAFHAIYWLLSGLQWETRDGRIPAVCAPEQRERELAAQLRRLDECRQEADELELEL